jgi:hypothetical protein
MPIKPTVSQLNANSVGILNAIRDNASAEYYQAVPQAQATTESIRAVGEQILAFQPRMNEFVSALINRIARVVVTSKLYSNPLAFAKKGLLEYGETIEEIFVDIAKANSYDWNSTNETEQAFKREHPDIKTAFHALNMQTYYKATVSEQNLRQAFLSLNGVTDLIARIVNSLYSGAAYDEYIMMKYVIAQSLIPGNVKMTTIDAVDDEASGKAAVKKVKAITGKLRFMSNEYNIAGVNTFISSPSDIFVVMTADYEASIDVDVLASAFNMDKVHFMGQRVLVDSFSFNVGELARLDELLENDPTYKRPSEDDLNALKSVGIVVMSRDWFQVYDVLNQFTEQYNAALLYWNEFNHVWRIYSASPFAPIVGFTTTTPAINAVTVNVASTAKPGDKVVAVATVTGTAFANKGVKFSLTRTTNATIDENTGVIVFNDKAVGSYTVTATSVFDPTKKGNASITIS